MIDVLNNIRSGPDKYFWPVLVSLFVSTIRVSAIYGLTALLFGV